MDGWRWCYDPAMNRLILSLLALVSLVACGRTPRATGVFRVGLITPGSIADAAWNSGAYAGLNAIRDSLRVEVSHVEARTPGEQQEALRAYAEQGFNLVFGHGFEFQGPAERIGAEYPKTIFVVTSGERVSATGNVVPMVFGIEEGDLPGGHDRGGADPDQQNRLHRRNRAAPHQARL
jgi:basic membrane lipoprotein Med (substrate-binding protein (PBP1-ABC) superfamily)